MIPPATLFAFCSIQLHEEASSCGAAEDGRGCLDLLATPRLTTMGALPLW
jgi:hypothetical protein